MTKRLAALVAALILTIGPALALQAAPDPALAVEPVLTDVDLGDDVTGMALAGALATIATFAARKILGEETLKGKPHVLGLVNAAFSVVIGAVATALTGPMGFVAALKTIGGAWLVSQGPRRLKKLIGIA